MEKRYFRFGEIPEDEKSVNFKKMPFSVNEDFGADVEFLGYKEAIKNVPEKYKEDGISVFEIENNLPKLQNLKLTYSLVARLDMPIFEVTGEEVGRGADGEPLLVNIRVVKCRRISKNALVELIVKTMCENFKVAEYDAKNADFTTLREFTKQQKVNIKSGEHVNIFEDVAQPEEWVECPEYVEYVFGGWRFSHPVDTFDISR